ncbi:MAG: glycosyltransferase family 4 protein [Candidatus Saccharibacteria bacterium]|nr:glycosyltransferase family 4 protein [Candidatus Saccharibacteria bacterium]
MKVLFIARRFPPSVGGMERFAKDLSGAIEHQIELSKITWGGSNKLLPLVLPWFFVKGFWRLLSNRDIKVIHMQDAVQAPIGWLLHVIFRKPYVVVAHGLDITYNSKIYQILILPFVGRADAVISISSATGDEAIKRGTMPGKSHVITLGTHDDYGKVVPDREQLSQEISYVLEDRTLLLTTGRLVKRKGVEWFITNVLPQLVKKDQNVLYLVAGDGVERDKINEAVTSNNMTDNVVLLGRVSDSVRSLLYQSCDVFVMPNIVVPGDMEGFGIVAHEAATAKLPVVASNLEGIADAIKNNKNGILVKSGDKEAFLRALDKLLKDRTYRKKFGEKAREFTLNEYSWENIANQYIKVYQELVSKDV